MDVRDLVERPLRCEVTTNPCGTDTWGNDYTCPCPSCQAHLALTSLSNPSAVRINLLRGTIAKPDDLVWLHDTNGPVAELRQQVESLSTRNAELEKALEPFAEFGIDNVDAVDGPQWSSTIHRESISDWFGPSNFHRAREALKAKP